MRGGVRARGRGRGRARGRGRGRGSARGRGRGRGSATGRGRGSARVVRGYRRFTSRDVSTLAIHLSIH